MQDDKESLDPQSKIAFPKRFLWGAATAAHQVEGNNHNQWSVWELENAKTLAAQSVYKDSAVPAWEAIKVEAKNPDNYVSGLATDHYRRYKEDFSLLESMNMNAFRFSIEWSRIEPKQGQWNAKEVEHYREYIAELKRRNIEPIVTLFHFTLPVWFSELGGFERRSNVRYFVHFAEKIIQELGTHIKFIITINEPEVYVEQGYLQLHFPPQKYSKVKAWRVLNNLAYAHNQTARALHKQNQRYKISIAKNSTYFYAGDNAWLSRVSSQIMQFTRDDYFLRKVIRQCDFLGVNYYFSNRVYGYRVHNPEDKPSDLYAHMAPEDIEHAIVRLYEKYHKPILITENGIADRDDVSRRWWITQTIVGMQRAMKEGVKVIGYLHWSLTDNFEWGFGRWPRFGLATIDYKTGDRTLRPSAIWFGKVIKHIRSKR